MANATKLHELLAVESNLKGQAETTTKATTELFEKKERHFSARDDKFVPFEENGRTEVVEKLELQTTVRQELKWLSRFFATRWDVILQVDAGNQLAKGDIILEDGFVIASDVPATTLLELEKEVRSFQDVIKVSKTLDPTKGFVADPTHALANVYRARDVSVTRTAKVQEALTLAPSTDKHPAQVQLITKDVSVGLVHKTEWSGLLTPSEKAEMLERCEILVRAIRKARARANDQEVNTRELRIGDRIFNYILTEARNGTGAQ